MDILSELGGIPGLGATGLLTLVVLLILNGKLITLRQHLEMRSLMQATIDSQSRTIETQRRQIQALLDAGETTKHVLTSLPKESQEG